jgi:hypothetical protein
MRKVFLSNLFLITTFVAGGQTPMPPGIVAPDWNWEATVASVYGDADYYTYWIDNTAPGNTDSGNPRGSPTTPRSTIPSTLTLTAGDVVQIRGGPYTGTTITINAVGTESEPVFIVGSPTARPELRRSIRVRNAAYLHISHLNHRTLNSVYDVRPVLATEEIHHLVWTYNEILGTGVDANGSAFGCSAAAEGFQANHHIVRAFNEISYCGNYNATAQNDLHGLGIGTNIHHIWDLYNEVHHLGGDSVGNGHQANHKTHTLFIGGNTFYANFENGVDLKEVHNVVISSNHIYDMAEEAAIVIHYGPDGGQGPWDIFILNNLIENCYDGIVSTELWNAVNAAVDTPTHIPLIYPGAPDIGSSYWVGNVIRGNTRYALAPDRGGGHFTLANNTVANSPYGLSASTGGNGVNSILAINNAYANISTHHIIVPVSTMRTNTTIRRSLVWNAGGVSSSWGTLYTSLASWISSTGKGEGSIQNDPLFVNLAENDFRLTEFSPMRGAGEDFRSPITIAYNAAFGTSNTDAMWEDRNGVAFGAVPDIGAFQSSDVEAAPDTPTLSSASALSTTRIRLSLAAAGTGEAATSIRIERSTTGSGSGFAFVTSVPADTTQWDDENLSPGITYYYRAQAVNAGGPSSYTGEVSEQTNEEAGRSGPLGRAALVRRRN